MRGPKPEDSRKAKFWDPRYIPSFQALRRCFSTAKVQSVLRWPQLCASATTDDTGRCWVHAGLGLAISWAHHAVNGPCACRPAPSEEAKAGLRRGRSVYGPGDATDAGQTASEGSVRISGEPGTASPSPAAAGQALAELVQGAAPEAAGASSARAADGQEPTCLS